jgi:hypothetical protein
MPALSQPQALIGTRSATDGTAVGRCEELTFDLILGGVIR